MSRKIEAVIGGKGIKQMNTGDVEPFEEWMHSEYHDDYEYALIFVENGPWGLCLSYEWSTDLPEEIVA